MAQMAPACNCHGGPNCCMRRLCPPLIAPLHKTYDPPYYPYQPPDSAKSVVVDTWTSNKSEPLTVRVPATRPEDV